jgi:hypothetical protein
MMYSTRFEIEIVPHGPGPTISYGLDRIANTVTVLEPMVLQVDQEILEGEHCFVIDFRNKTNDTPSMAVEITRVTVEGMTLDRFRWSSRYYPDYPEPWASEQKDPLPKYHDSATYLGWNGRWEFRFSAPIFKWIHRLENLGWIYD